jgi:plastocyanin
MTRRRPGKIAALCVAAIMLAFAGGCSTGGSTAPATSTGSGGTETPAAGVTVVMKDTAFDTLSPVMKAGQSITFKNEDTVPHDIKMEGQDSGVIAPGKSWSLKIDKAGMYPFQCTIHPSMAGQLTVR